MCVFGSVGSKGWFSVGTENCSETEFFSPPFLRNPGKRKMELIVVRVVSKADEGVEKWSLST